MLEHYQNKRMGCSQGKHDVVDIKATGDDDLARTQLGYKFRGKCQKCGDSIVAKKMSEYVQFKE